MTAQGRNLRLASKCQTKNNVYQVQAAVVEPKIGQKLVVVTSSWESALPLGKRKSNHNESPNKPTYKVETINPSFLSTHIRGLKASSFTYYAIA